MGLPDILKVHFFLIPMMYVLCLVGFCPGILDIWLTSSAVCVRVAQSDAVFFKHRGDFMKDVIYAGTMLAFVVVLRTVFVSFRTD